MFGILKQLSARETDIVGEGVVEVLLDGFGFCAAGSELPARRRTTSRLTLEIRRFGLRTGDTIDGTSEPEGRRALLRSPQGQFAQFRGPREGAPQSQLRQFNAALSGRVAEDGIRGSDQEGSLGARHRHRRSDRERPARADRVAAAHRQDRAAAKHRAFDHAQPPGRRPHRAVDRRAAGRSDRHAALGEGRGRSPRPSTSPPCATSRSPRW